MVRLDESSTYGRFGRRWHWEHPDLGRDDWSDTVWFAPEVKTLVKLERWDRGGAEWELVSYSLKQEESPQR